jgi:hypothetical protein
MKNDSFAHFKRDLRQLGRVARCYIVFIPKFSIWVYFGGLWNGKKCWYILGKFGIFYGHSVHLVVICYIFPPFWYIAPRKIWQPFNWVRQNALPKRNSISCLKSPTVVANWNQGDQGSML